MYNNNSPNNGGVKFAVVSLLYCLCRGVELFEERV